MTHPDPSRVAHRHASASRVARRHVAGLFEPPPRVLKAVEEWAMGIYAGHILARVEESLSSARRYPPSRPGALVEMNLLARECKKYTSRAWSYKRYTRTTLPIDLSGWKYLAGMSASEIEQKQVEAGFTDFTCTLFFKTHKDRTGLWTPRTMQMELDLLWGMSEAGTVKEFRKAIQWLRDIARHETIHLGQTALMKMKDLGEWRAGYPSFDMHEEGGDSEIIGGKRIPHPRRSVEFYTRLADEVSEFAVKIKSIPLPKRREYLRRWIDTHESFSENKGNLSKWKKMVGEFISEIDKQGIYIPSATAVSETATISKGATIEPDTTIQGSPHILDQAKVLGSATVKDSAQVRDKAVVKGYAVVGGSGYVLDQARVSGHATLSGNYIISGDATVINDAVIEGGSGRGVQIQGRVWGGVVKDNAWVLEGGSVGGGVVKDNARVLGTIYDGVVEGEAIVGPNARVGDGAVISDSAKIVGSASVSGVVRDTSEIKGDARIYRGVTVQGESVISGNTLLKGGIWTDVTITGGVWSEMPQTRKLSEGDVVFFRPRRSQQAEDSPQWVIVEKVLGKGLKQEPEGGGIVRAPYRYTLWAMDSDGFFDPIGDWDDFDLDLDREAPANVVRSMQESWSSYAA